MATSIFISYRRGQSVKDARAIYERLRREFGADNVFMDLEGLAFGEDFVESLERHLAGCRVMLALIGPQWLTAEDDLKQLRLNDPDDFVRIELRTALARPGVRVVPVLLDGAQMPTVADLPQDLRALRRRHAFALRDNSFDADMRQLCDGLRPVLEAGAPTASPPLAQAAPATPPAPAATPAAPSVPAPPPTAAVRLSDQTSGKVTPLPPLLSRRALVGGGVGAAALVGAIGWATRGKKEEAPAPAPALAPMRPAPSTDLPAWASAQGQDNFGRWSEFSIAGVIQRLRWIEPGEFLMGSPKTEPDRDGDEGPQHRVRISQGFWLADTACTQALWLAVVGGSNPAKFTDDRQNPVEQVSHLDVEKFLAALAGKLGHGATPVLPTEAQWEYACRAGTTTPFSFGATVTPEQVNYDGNFPYGSAAKGLYRQRTVPVKALPANRWGLHQMHGNVWEWCADGMRKYADVRAEVVEDPTGPQEQGPEAPRAVRGGSWINRAHLVRSAYRDAPQRRDAVFSLGFRFALRS